MKQWLEYFYQSKVTQVACVIIEFMVGLVFDTFLFALGLSFGIAIAVTRPTAHWRDWSGMLLGICLYSLVFTAIRGASREHGEKPAEVRTDEP